MKKYTLKRIITSLFTLLAILLVLFILMQLMPGSPFNDEKLTPEMRASLYAKYGLDQPIYVQFFRYVTNMLRGDFGVDLLLHRIAGHLRFDLRRDHILHLLACQLLRNSAFHL